MATWAAVTKLSPRPKWLLTRAGGAVPHPGFLLLGTPGNATGPVVILMLMHLAIAVITYTALTKIAPLRWRPAMNVTPGHAARSV
jgi:hypothetical protein